MPGYALQVAVSRAVAARRLGASGELGRDDAPLDAAARARDRRRGASSRALLREPLADLLNVDAPWAAAATAPDRDAVDAAVLKRGVLAGLGGYRAVGLSIVGEAVGRLVLGLGLVGVGLGTTGAYLGTPLAMAVAALGARGACSARSPGRTAGGGAPPLRPAARVRATRVPTLRWR